MNKVYKSILAMAATAIVAGTTLVVPTTSVLAWGDSANGRPVYTLDEINAGKLGDTITFNSITNGKIGDERNFVGAKVSSDTNNVWNADQISVKDGETYTIRLYVHNNSPKGTAKIAENVKATFSLPTVVGKELTVVGYLDSSNATPGRYWDEVKFVSDGDFYLEYVDGSAKYTNVKMGTVSLPNEVITSGATLGYEKLDGKIPGCYEYDGQVTIQVKVHTSVNSKLANTVRIKGTKTWSESVDVKVGDEVEYQIEYENLGSAEAKNVMIRDILPDNVQYIAGSTYLYNSSNPNGVKLNDDTLTTNGINIGNYGSKGNAFIRFTAKVVEGNLTCNKKTQLVNWASATVNSKVYKDDASVMVTRNCEQPTPTTTDAKISKTVRIKGTTEWKESVDAKIGDEVEFQIEYTNTGTSEAKNVKIVDTLPSNLEYVANSTYLYNSSNKDGKKLSENTLTTTGINIGNYGANGNAFVRFTAKVVDKNIACGQNNQLVNWASATIDSKMVKDDASVMTTKTCPVNPTPTPTPTPTPSVIVNTGATEIVTGAMGAGLTVTGLGYYIASRKKLLNK